MRACMLGGLGLLGILGVTATGCGELDTADRVHDLRLLAIQADPPEQVLNDALIAGVSGGTPAPGEAGPRPTPQLLPETIRALVADPAGSGREVSYRFSLCLAVDGDTRRCSENSPGYRVLSEGTVTPGALGAEPSVAFTPEYSLVNQLVLRDAYHGLGGVQLLVQIEIQAGDESVVGLKRVTFTFAPLPLPPANTNPVIASIQFNDTDWAPERAVEFFATARQPRQFPGTGTPGPTTGTNKLSPRVEPARFEEYDRPRFDGGSVHFKETWRYNFFATQGTFATATTTASEDGTGGNSNWTTLPGEPGGSTAIWIVVRDGRGGENWLARTAVAPTTASTTGR